MKSKSRGLEKLPGLCYEMDKSFLSPQASFFEIKEARSLKRDLWNLRQGGFFGANYANQTTACVGSQRSPEGKLR